ncbi:hypothetical protein GCM10009680_22460 [Streptomyces yatensis]|uniref:Uncharacterized protein n=1 Tax=Streptomyces yatensis TaxID=155177 RepID=A0ABN2H755_9ACTN
MQGTHRLLMLAQRLVRPGQGLHGAQPALLQGVRGGRERRAGHGPGERRAAPQAERLAEQPDGLAGGGLRAGLGGQLVEALGVDQGLGYAQQIGGAVGGQLDAVLLGAALGQGGAEPGDMALDDGPGVGGRLVLPQAGYQLLHGHRRVGPQQQHRQHAAPFGGPQR